MSLLFEPLTLRSLTLRNRVWLAPMCQYSAVDGVPNDWHLVHLGARATGGFGLVFTEASAVTPEGRISPQDAGIWNDEQAAAWRRIVDFVHGQGAPIGVQLAHAGRKASSARPWEGGLGLKRDQDPWQTIGPSAIAPGAAWQEPRAMDEADMAQVREAFVTAAKRALPWIIGVAAGRHRQHECEHRNGTCDQMRHEAEIPSYTHDRAVRIASIVPQSH